jgi:putative ABC transport system ATP-binding protein
MGCRQSKAGAVLRQSNQYTRALVNESSVILADEPTGNLDSRSGAAIMDLMQQLHQDRKVTIVLVTHDSTIAGRAERTIRLSDGQVEAVA